MTKSENMNCEKLMIEAIRKANSSKNYYESYEKFSKKWEQAEADCKLRLADQEHGYAEGICQALVCIGFKHERMKELNELL